MNKKDFIEKLEHAINFNIDRVSGYDTIDEFDNWYIEAMKQILVDIEFINNQK